MIEPLQNEALSQYCTFRIGGPADFFAIAKNTEELLEAVKFAKEKAIPYFIIGSGTNILFDDKGFRGLIIKNQSQNITAEDDKITADAGVPISQLLEKSLKNNLSGLEKWAGLPGTVGGAVYGNAGCNGLETKDILTKAQILDPKTDETKEADNKYFNFAYRYSKLKESDEILLNATFKLEKQSISPEEQQKITEEIQKNRVEKQPPGFSSGSFFKNPSPDKPAGMLIDQAGLKGKTIGKAQISEKHANFILNLGGATSEDIKNLAKLAKQEIKTKFNINLKEEVQIFSEYGKIEL